MPGLHRALGLLAEPAGAEPHFAKALSDPAGDAWPFERAQLQLDYGELTNAEIADRLSSRGGLPTQA